MAQLLWKEYREKRLWLLLVAGAVVFVVLMKSAYTFIGDWNPGRSLWDLLPCVLAILMGLSACSSELAGETASFLYSRPVSWKKLLLAKLAVGIGILAAAAIIGAIVYRVTCPAAYVRYATLGSLAQGVGEALLLTGLPYLVGFAMSVVLPGLLGGTADPGDRHCGGGGHSCHHQPIHDATEN